MTSIPFLWTVVCVPWMRLGISDLEFIERIVERSYPLPFQLQITLPNDDGDKKTAEALHIRLKTHVSRCRSLFIFVRGEAGKRNFKSMLPLQWPSLDELYLLATFTPGHEENAVEYLVDGVSSLRSLILDGAGYDWLEPTFSSLSGLQYLELLAFSVDYDTAYTILPSLPNLKVLLLERCDPFPHTPPLLHLPSLECLYMSERDGPELLPSIRAPRLEVLHLVGRPRHDWSTQSWVVESRESRAPSVPWRELTLNCAGYDPGIVLGLAGLKALTYRGMNPSANNALFEGLLAERTSEQGAASKACDSLESLTLPIVGWLRASPNAFDIDEDTFIVILSEFVSKRRLQSHRLPLHIYLDLELSDNPTLAALCGTNNHSSVVIHFCQDVGERDSDRRAKMDFAKKWRPAWWTKS